MRVSKKIRDSGSRSEVQMWRPRQEWTNAVGLTLPQCATQEQAKGERKDRRPNEQTRSRGKQEHNGHEQPKTGANGVYTHNIRRTEFTRAADTSSKWLHQCI
jgi:hypothetical protein